MSAEQVLAALGATVCLVLLIWPLVPARFQQVWRMRWSRLSQSLVRGWQSATSKPRQKPAGKPQFKDAAPHAQAEREAQAAIDKARRRADSVERDGNVYRPRSFGAGKDKRSGDDPTLH